MSRTQNPAGTEVAGFATALLVFAPKVISTRCCGDDSPDTEREVGHRGVADGLQPSQAAQLARKQEPGGVLGQGTTALRFSSSDRT